VRALVVSVLLLLPWSPAARADQEAARVVLIDPGAPALSQRLEEEIEALGLSVIELVEVRPGESLEERARGAQAVAAIRITKTGAGLVEMTIVDRATGKTVSRRLAIATPADPASAELVATRTVELLRASLMELSAAHPARGDAPVTPKLEQIAAPPAAPRSPADESVSRLALALGPAVAWSPGLGAAADASVGLTFIGPSRLGVTLQALLPLQAHHVRTREGRIDVTAWSYRLALALELPLGRGALRSRLFAGGLLTKVTASGETDSPFVAAEEEFLTGGPWLGAGVELELSKAFAVFAGADAGFSFPRTVLRSAGNELTSFGRPLCAGSTGVSVSWR
jgi:hypothetical protein